MKKIWKISDLWAVIDKITEILVLIFFGTGQSGMIFFINSPFNGNNECYSKTQKWSCKSTSDFSST